MKKNLLKLFILFSLLLTVIANATPLSLDIADTTNIEMHSDYPLDDDRLE